MYKHILVPLDGSELAEQMLPHVDALVAKFGSRITLVRAISCREKIIAADREEAEAYLAACAKRLNCQGLPAHYECLEGSQAEVIAELARQLAIDLIAMTTHGRSGLARVLLGSVAAGVVQNTPCPVLLVHVREATSGQ
jgi:nucleotide-binding universal stress UspA family protein